MAWDRNTPWRQGHVLPDDAAAALGLVTGAKDAVIIVSHDCDLAQTPDREPNLEVIVGRLIDKADGNFTFGKAPRCLHLTFSAGTAELTVELLGSEKQPIGKDRLGEFAPASEVILSAKELETLQRWLAARYWRSAFPDEFDYRLEKTGVHARLYKILKRHGPSIMAIYFDLDQGEDRIRAGSEDVYELALYLLYEADGDGGALAATSAAGEIEKAFRERCCCKTGVWHDIELVTCEAISDQAMTIGLARRLRKWNIEHLSMRAGTPQAMLTD
jgi:hypothetical protein